MGEDDTLFDANLSLAYVGDNSEPSPLHRVLSEGSREVIAILLDRGANVHGILGVACGLPAGSSVISGHRSSDSALRSAYCGAKSLPAFTDAGPNCDLTIAAALVEEELARRMPEAKFARI